VVPCTFRYGVATLAKVLLPASHSRDVSLDVEEVALPPRCRRPQDSNPATPKPTPKTKQLPRDSRVDLPLWLAKPLAERHIAAVSLPPAYGERMRRRAAAGAECVDLRPHPNFYGAGLRIAPLVGDALVAAYLRQTFAERYRALLADSLRAPDGGALHEATKRLNEEERKLFGAGREGAAAQEAWWARGGRRACKSAPAAVVAEQREQREQDKRPQQDKQRQQQAEVGAKRKAGAAGGGGGGAKRAAAGG
jgi:hypothetical protein